MDCHILGYLISTLRAQARIDYQTAQKRWLSELIGDKDSAFLSDGICNGFHLVKHGSPNCHVDMDNYKSAANPVNKPKVDETIRGEIMQGNYVISAVQPRIVSALGAIPKPESSEVRLIHD